MRRKRPTSQMIRAAVGRMPYDTFGAEDLVRFLMIEHPREYALALQDFAGEDYPLEAFERFICRELRKIPGLVSTAEEAESKRLHGPDAGLDQHEIDTRDRFRKRPK